MCAGLPHFVQELQLFVVAFARTVVNNDGRGGTT